MNERDEHARSGSAVGRARRAVAREPSKLGDPRTAGAIASESDAPSACIDAAADSTARRLADVEPEHAGICPPLQRAERHCAVSALQGPGPDDQEECPGHAGQAEERGARELTRCAAWTSSLLSHS